MSATLPHELLESLRDLASATTRTDCTTRIGAQLERLFPGLGVALELEPRAAGAGGPSIALQARGRHHGRLRLASAGELDDDDRQRLEAFAEHAALALDNARLLEDHDRRARRDPLTGLLNRGEFPRAADDRGGALQRQSRRAAEPGGL